MHPYCIKFLDEDTKNKNSTKVIKEEKSALALLTLFFRGPNINNHASNSCFEASYSFLKHVFKFLEFKHWGPHTLQTQEQEQALHSRNCEEPPVDQVSQRWQARSSSLRISLSEVGAEPRTACGIFSNWEASHQKLPCALLQPHKSARPFL